MKNDLISDSLNLVKNILDSLLPEEKGGIVNIARDKRDSFQLKGIATVYGYKQDKTPEFLEKYGVIEAKNEGKWYIKNVDNNDDWVKLVLPEINFVDPIFITALEKDYLEDNQIPKYYYEATYWGGVPSIYSWGQKLHGQMAILVNWKALESFKVRFDNKVDEQNAKTFHYENGEFRLIRQDGSPCTLDFSKAPEYKPVFESFFLLYRDNNKKLFNRDELLKKYKELTKRDTNWRDFIKQKSSIVGKMINKKPCLKNRIIWEHDKETDMYRFEILPLSDN